MVIHLGLANGGPDRAACRSLIRTKQLLIACIRVHRNIYIQVIAGQEENGLRIGGLANSRENIRVSTLIIYFVPPTFSLS